MMSRLRSSTLIWEKPSYTVIYAFKVRHAYRCSSFKVKLGDANQPSLLGLTEPLIKMFFEGEIIGTKYSFTTQRT